jgi:hypothetical protein
MRTASSATLMAVLACLAVPALADAPQASPSPKTMGEAAAATQKKKPAKVFTEDDLHNHGRAGSYSEPGAGGTSTPSATPSASPSPGAAGDKKAGDAAGEKPKTEEEIRADQEKAWRDKLTQAQKDVDTWTAEVSRLQSAMNDNTGPMYGPGRAARADALENAKRQLAAAQQTVESLQEEGRRNRFR